MDTRQGSIDSRMAMRKKVIAYAADAFAEQGIKAVRVGDIAEHLGVSKRTIYELFADKEDILVEVMKYNIDRRDAYLKELSQTCANVLEIMFRLYERSVHDFQRMNMLFFREMTKYPRLMKVMQMSHSQKCESMVKFYRQGVSQGIFRDDVNYELACKVNMHLNQLFTLTEVEDYSLSEIIETVVFVPLRGCSTQLGIAMVDEFLAKLHDNTNLKKDR